MNAVYVRVSTDEQAKTGYSLQDQLQSCRQRLLSLGLPNISEYVDDGYSGEFLERPALERLRDDLRAGTIENVCVYDPDRLSRNLTNQLILADEIEKAGAKLLFVTGDYDASPEGRLFFSMRGAISAFEKAKIRERTMRGKRAKVLSGKPLFAAPPFGYSCDRVAGQYVIVPEEAEIIRDIFARYSGKKYGILPLGADLRACGIVNIRTGKPFSASVLHRMITNEMYAGTKWTFQIYQKLIAQKKRKIIHRDKSEWVAITIPAIIDRETWEKTCEVREQNKVMAKRNSKREYLLSGVIKCAGCGYAMRGITYPKRTKKEYGYYVCTAYINENICNCKTGIPVQELDEAVWNHILQTYSASYIAANKRRKTIDKPRHDTEAQLANLKARKATILKWVSAGTVDMDEAEKELKNLNTSINAVMESLESKPKIIDISPKEIASAKTMDEKRRVLLKLKIKVYAKKEGGKISYTIRDS
ncbi:DNA-invertase hin [Sporomusa ovata DSM 2662]|uniref:Phage DNA invertase n=1 Tax=Sporomusa ovata TaxID=2378 RepID=A0A0U1L5C8_9FIRM|nr:recombinase family protein [Sporomusa ovata]EQB25550.1 putative DNA recombinase [Sporomusa ovata DSM 2662]CQR74114.1 Phage DNA invertase [Sporomusa ovata]